MSKLRWGILGAGRIAGVFARALAQSRTGELLAIGSRSQESADRFGEEFGVPRRYAPYEALLADPEVQAVYIATPHPTHAEWAIAAAKAGKHILCEKPLTMNYAEAVEVIEAARRHDVFLMEAFMYRCHPQTARLVELIRAGALGRVGVIQATFSFKGPEDPTARHLNKDLGGGGILDVGCYPVSMARLLAGAALGTGVAEPLEVQGTGHLGDTGVDDYALACLRFPEGILAQLATGVRLRQENVVRVFGSEGMVYVPWPWQPGRVPGPITITLHRWETDESQVITIEADRGVYAFEADVVAENLERRQAPYPAMTWDDTLGNMKVLDRWRECLGLEYEANRRL